MQKRPHRFQKTLRHPASSPAAEVASLSLDDLSHYAEGWLADCEIRQHSASTLATRRMTLKNLLWLLRRRERASCGTSELREFFTYLIHGHKEAGGRWGNPQMTRLVRPRTVDTYHGHLRTFFAWVIQERGLTISPMALISAPVCRADQIHPFTQDQLEAVLAAAQRTQNPRRDEAIIMLLLDTGIRASELCGLKHRDLDLTEKRITVLGKGNKRRTIYFGQRATKALWSYLRDKEIEDDAPLFPSERSTGKGNHLSRYGLRDMIERLAASSGVQGVRCSAHTFRHTFAVSFLRAGGQVFALKEILGHTDLKMTAKYVSLAEADLASQRRFSPADQLRAGRAADRPRVWKRGKDAPKRVKEAAAGHESSKKTKTEAGPHSEKITRAKLTEEQVRAIKVSLAAGALRMEIADAYGLAPSTVKEIALGYTWRHVYIAASKENQD